MVYTIYTNNNFLDAGKPVKGDFEKEYNLMKQLFLSDEL